MIKHKTMKRVMIKMKKKMMKESSNYQTFQVNKTSKMSSKISKLNNLKKILTVKKKNKEKIQSMKINNQYLHRYSRRNKLCIRLLIKSENLLK